MYEPEQPEPFDYRDLDEQAREIVRPYAQAGATWWMESRWSASDEAEIRTRIQQGPPRVEA